MPAPGERIRWHGIGESATFEDSECVEIFGSFVIEWVDRAGDEISRVGNGEAQASQIMGE